MLFISFDKRYERYQFLNWSNPKSNNEILKLKFEILIKIWFGF